MPSQVLLLISGKRSSGKDFLCQQIRKQMRPILGVEKFAIGNIVKRTYAERNGVSFSQLQKKRRFKEEHREGLLKLSQEMEPGYCERLLLGEIQKCEEPIMMIADVRTRENLAFFETNFKPTLSIRVSASHKVREDVSWEYHPQIDGGKLECDLDWKKDWDLRFHQSELKINRRKRFVCEFVERDLYPKIMDALQLSIKPPWLPPDR